MGVLDDLLDGSGGGTAPQGRGFGDLAARAVAGPPRPAAGPAAAPDLAPLLACDDAALVRLLRYLPADAMVPLLARAPVPVAARLVGLLDAESQAWLGAQSEAIEACTPEAHAAAARRALELLPRARDAAPAAASPAPAAAAPARPVAVGFSFATEPVPAATPAPAPAPAPAAATPADDTVETLAALVALATGRDAAGLAEIAAAADHPVLEAGLAAVARGDDAHGVDAAVRAAGAAWLEEQTRRVELMRLAALAVRFGDGPQRFRDQARSLGG